MPEHPTSDRWERDMLIQLNEQVKGLRHDVNRHAEADEEEFRKIERRYVTKDEFNPSRLICYGLVGVIVLAVVTALVSIVVGGKIHTP